ncbi:PAS domain S-box protein [bacterium]|nr:MAG: PAS domain S-box protein [bacterium]
MPDPSFAFWPAQITLQSLLEANDAAVVGISSDGVVRAWNTVARRIFHFEAEDIIGHSLTRLIPDQWQNEARRQQEAVLSGEKLPPTETVRLDKEGRRVHVSLSGAPLHDESGAVCGALWLMRDIAERRKAQGELAQLQAHAEHRSIVLETANRVALDILSSRSGVEALRHIAEAARVLAGARYAALGVARPDGAGLSQFITVGLTAEEETAIGPRPGGAGVLGLLLQRTKPLRVDVLADHPASVGFPPNHPPMESFLGVPIRRGNVVVGSLYLTNKLGGGAFTTSDEVAVEALGAHAAVAIYNLQMVLRQNSLVSGLITAQEEERRAVAYDLHDGLTQFVMASHAHLEAFQRARAKGNEERANREFEQGKRYLKEAVVESRRLVNGLRSLALDDLGLPEALRQLVNEEKTRAGWESIEWLCDIEEMRFDKDLETTVYRVAQEALTNARKHAATQSITVTLSLVEGESPQLKLEIRDQGVGFVPEEKMGETERVGMQSMAERVHLLNGQFRVASSPGAGTSIIALFPALPLPKEPLESENTP